MAETIQRCPVCSVEVRLNLRYPRYLCRACASEAASADGRLLEFYNEGIFGGYAARYAATEEPYASHECFVRGVRCHAKEARFGGIVIQTVE